MDEIHECFILKHNSWLVCLLKVFLFLCWFWDGAEVYTRTPGDCKNKTRQNGHPHLEMTFPDFPMLSSSPRIFIFHNFPEGHWLQDSSHDQNSSSHQTHIGRGAKGVSGGANVKKMRAKLCPVCGLYHLTCEIINPLAYVGVPPWAFASCSP